MHVCDCRFDCDGDCLLDSDNDHICDQDEVTGCQDMLLVITTQQRRMLATAIIQKRITIAMAIA